MSNTNLFSLQTIVGFSLLIVCAVILRLIPHPPNVAPIAALALFGGVYLDKRVAFIIPLLAMVFSDMFLGFSQSAPYIYVSFLLTVGIGLSIRRHKSFFTVIGGTLLSSVLFFLITNFGFWLTFSLYPKTIDGQLLAYFNALPFFRNSLIGDFLYTGLLFGSYELAKQVVKKYSFVFVK